jgi:hypothetical protein
VALRVHALLDQGVASPRVLLLRPAEGLVLVGVNQRADALVGEDLGQQPLRYAAVDQVKASMRKRTALGERSMIEILRISSCS